MGWVAGESRVCRAFLFSEVSGRDPHRFMGEMILTTLKNGAGEIGEGRLDSGDARGEFKVKIFQLPTLVRYFPLSFTKSQTTSIFLSFAKL